MHLLNWELFLYEVILQVKDRISHNLYKLLLIQSLSAPIYIIKVRFEVVTYEYALCMIRITFFPFSMFNKFSLCNKAA